MNRFARYRERREAIAHLLKEEREDDEWLKAVVKVFGGEVVAAVLADLPQVSVVELAVSGRTGTRRTRNGQMTWTAFILDQLNAAGGRISYDGLREAAKGTELEASLVGPQKAFHSAMGKLVARLEAVRQNGWLFTPAAFAEYTEAVENGTEKPLYAAGYSRASPLSDAIRSFIQRNPNGVTGKEVVDYVAGIEHLSEATTKGTSGVYNVLARLTKRGEITREGGVYRPTKDNVGLLSPL